MRRKTVSLHPVAILKSEKLQISFFLLLRRIVRNDSGLRRTALIIDFVCKIEIHIAAPHSSDWHETCA